MRHRAPDRMSVQHFRSQRPDGTEEERLWSPVNAPVLGDDGEVTFIVHHVEDVTTRFAAEPRVEEAAPRASDDLTFGAQGAAAFVDLAFAQAPVAIAVLRGRELVFACCNRAYGALAGHRPLVGRSIREAFPELDVETIYGIMHDVYATGVPYIVNEFPVHGDGPGPEIYYNFVYQPLTDAEGSVTGIAVLATDVTELVLERAMPRKRRADRSRECSAR
jgi:PAS domain-containing protein